MFNRLVGGVPAHVDRLGTFRNLLAEEEKKKPTGLKRHLSCRLLLCKQPMRSEGVSHVVEPDRDSPGFNSPTVQTPNVSRSP